MADGIDRARLAPRRRHRRHVHRRRAARRAPAAGSIVDKTLTTPAAPLDGVRTGVRQLLAKAGVRPADITAPIVHATTLITNALIEGKIGRAGVVTTDGFGDTMLIRDEHRYDMYDLQIEFPAPPVPRDRVVEIAERTNPLGDVVESPTTADLDAITDALRDAEGRGGRRVPDQRLRQPGQRARRSPSTCAASSACRCASRPRSRRRSASTRG